MILLYGVFLLLLPTESLADKSFRSHLADNLKLKCYALPYRTIFDGNRCYFAIFRKVIFSNAHIACSETMKGAEVAVKVPDVVLSAMMVDKSTFHTDSEASDAKYTICVRDSVFTCDKDQTLTRGKCISHADKKMNYAEAQKHCKKAGMELFSPNNDLDNQIILRELAKNPVWIQKSLSKRSWSLEKSYARFGSCDGKSKNPSLNAGSKRGCNTPSAAVIDKTGYWSSTDQKNELDVICTKNAVNELTPVEIKKVSKVETCVEEHEWVESTGTCEWTGPSDACAKLVNHWNHTYFVSMPEFPMFPNVEVDLAEHPMNDIAIKVVVRKGCMFTGFAHPLNGNEAFQEIKVGENLIYGAHRLPNTNLDLEHFYDGLSRASCWCDPTEATVNGHLPSPPADRKCIEHHVFNETTQQCEWVHDNKFCAEIITTDNRRMRLEMPGWPEKKKYDVNHYATKFNENFHITVSNIVVRQHCVATLIRWHYHEDRMLPTSGNGYHDVVHYPKLTKRVGQGTGRFMCECIK